MKKFLLATAAVLMSTSAYAADYGVVHPFYTPSKGKVESVTNFRYVHFSYSNKDGNTREDVQINKELDENVTYGVTDDIQIGLNLSRDYVRRGIVKHYNTGWGINAGYNIINDGKAFLKAGLGYSQAVNKTKGFANDAHSKGIGLTVLGGYNFDEFTVYGSTSYDRQIDGEKRAEKSKEYGFRAGVFKQFNDQISANTSLSAFFSDTEQRNYWWNASADYSFTKDMSVGVDASYLLDMDLRGKNRRGGSRKAEEVHRGYDFEVNFKIAF